MGVDWEAAAGERAGRRPGQRWPGPAGRLLPRLPGHARHAGHGYGINYEYGLFRQEIATASRSRSPTAGSHYATPWQIERPAGDAIALPVYGRVEHATDRGATTTRCGWTGRWSSACRTTCSSSATAARRSTDLRLFTARASQEVDMSIFNLGDSHQGGAAEDRCRRRSPRSFTPASPTTPAGSCV